MKLAPILALALLAGCASQPQFQWVAGRNADSTPKDAVIGICNAAAHRAYAQSQPISISMNQYVGAVPQNNFMQTAMAIEQRNQFLWAAFEGCMYERGYYKVAAQ